MERHRRLVRDMTPTWIRAFEDALPLEVRAALMGMLDAPKFLPFEEARAIVRGLGLKNQKEWCVWSKTRPSNIPSSPYTHKEWVSWGDWLGTGRDKIFLPFEDAREYVRGLGLKSSTEWKAWSKSNSRPSDIPSNPNTTYTEWKDMADWIGCPRFLPFEEARDYVRGLGLKGAREWEAWCTDKRPSNVTAIPNKHYAGKGWVSWGDWLGTGNIKGGQKGRKWRNRTA